MTTTAFPVESPPPVPRLTPVASLVLVSASVFGLYWLACDVVAGLQSGRDSDLHRRWVVCQYVRDGINPYPLALAALEHKYGALGGGRAKPRVYAIPRLSADEVGVDSRAGELLHSQGTPEAVYPPSADLLLSLTLGPVPERLVHLVGMVVNLVLLGVCTALLCRMAAPELRSTPAVLTAVALVLLWSPARTAVLSGQFSILVTVCLLLAFRDLERHEYRAGAWLAVALVKPSLTLPFLILPLIRGRWRVLAVAIGFHAAATILQALRFGVLPWDLLRQWTGVAAYFTQGQFTLQEVLSALRLADTAAGHALVLGVVLFATGWCLWNRAASDDLLVDWLCFVSVLWTYHGPYDFVVLLIPLVRRLVPAAVHTTQHAAALFTSSLAVALFLLLSIAASPLAYGDEVHIAARFVRHGARLALLASAIVAASQVWRAARFAEGNSRPAARHHDVRADDLLRLPA
jgi:hypothetical protein